MDPGTAYMVSEFGKLAIQSWFSLMTMQGKTAEEMEQMFQDERQKFLERDPADLPKPPPE
jgi:hypothetical protein